MIGDQKRYAANFNQVWIYIDGREDGDLQGTVFHPGQNHAWRFGGLIQLIQRCEHLYNTLQYPRSAYRLRSMKNNDDHRSEMAAMKNDTIAFNEKDKGMPTFIVKVQYRQNASWQGSVQWVEAGKTMNFRSTLELLKLMDEAVNEGDNELSWD